MSAIKLSLYLYRVFALVFASFNLYLVAQEVDLNWPFPNFAYLSENVKSACDAKIWLQKSRQSTGVKMRDIVNCPKIESWAIENPLEFTR